MEVWHVIGEVKEQVDRSQHHSTVAVLQTLIQNILKANKYSMYGNNIYIAQCLYPVPNGYFVNYNISQEEIKNNNQWFYQISD